MPVHKDDALTTTTNPAYGIIMQGRGGRGGGGDEGDGGREQENHEYEVVDVPLRSGPLIPKAHETPSASSHQPLPTIPLSVAPPTGRDMGVAKEAEEERVYDNIPGDQ